MASNISNNNNNIKLELEFLIAYNEWFQEYSKNILIFAIWRTCGISSTNQKDKWTYSFEMS